MYACPQTLNSEEKDSQEHETKPPKDTLEKQL